tara:strand:+ start:2064 stop:2936 length:873 start_codon:yes stop_codon:yes gene_type:complete
VTDRVNRASHAAFPIPAQAGIGLRSAHYGAIAERRPAVAWFEAHTENYFVDGGAQIEALHAIRADYPLSFHGVGLSLGSADEVDDRHLAATKRLVDRFEPALVSEHLCWSSIDGQHLNDLLPLPYTAEALVHVSDKIMRCQDALGRGIIIENVSSYLEFTDSEMNEWEFLANVASRADCGILLDVNNVYVNARNHGFDARTYIDALPGGRIRELHLAGHRINRIGDHEILLDTHDGPVCEAVWRLYRYTIERIGARPTLIEWDNDIPDVDVLAEQAAVAQGIMDTFTCPI